MSSRRCVYCRKFGDAEPCRYCQRYTCATCHHGNRHLHQCPETARRETHR